MRLVYAIIFLVFAGTSFFFWMIVWGFGGHIPLLPDASLFQQPGGWFDWVTGVLALYGPIAVAIWAFVKVVSIERARSGKR